MVLGTRSLQIERCDSEQFVLLVKFMELMFKLTLILPVLPVAAGNSWLNSLGGTAGRNIQGTRAKGWARIGALDYLTHASDATWLRPIFSI